jgi:hypothetical protein
MLKQPKTENPMGAGKKQALRVAFDSRLKLEFHGAKVTSDAGLLAYRELDEALNLTSPAAELLNDWRTGDNTPHSMVTLLRQSLYSRLAGYEDTNDAEGLSVDPTMRQVVLPRSVRHWTLTTLREKLIKIGAKVVRHSRQVVFQMAEVAVPRELFRAILERIGRLRLAVASSG